MNFIRKFRDVLIDIEAAYAESRYSLSILSKELVESMYKVAKDII